MRDRRLEQAKVDAAAGIKHNINPFTASLPAAVAVMSQGVGKALTYGADWAAEQAAKSDKVGNGKFDSPLDIVHALTKNAGISDNGKFDSGWDIARFVGNLPGGVASAPISASSKLTATITGKDNQAAADQLTNAALQGMTREKYRTGSIAADVQKTTQDQNINILQRAANLGDAGIDVAGMAIGGEAGFLKALGGGTSRQIIGTLLKSAVDEGIEEGVQQILGNIAKTGVINKDTLSGVPQAFGLGAAGGGIMTGAGLTANLVGGNNTVDPSQLQRNNATRDTISPTTAIANTVDNLRTAAVNKNAVDRLTSALELGANGDVKFVRLGRDFADRVNSLRIAEGKAPLPGRQTNAYKNAINNHLSKHVGEYGSPRAVAEAAYRTLTDVGTNVLPAEGANTLLANKFRDAYSSVVLGIAQDDGTSIKSISPRGIRQIEKLSLRKQELLNGLDGASSPSSSAELNPVGSNAISALQAVNSLESASPVGDTSTARARSATNTQNISKPAQNVNSEAISHLQRDKNDSTTILPAQLEAAQSRTPTTAQLQRTEAPLSSLQKAPQPSLSKTAQKAPQISLSERLSTGQAKISSQANYGTNFDAKQYVADQVSKQTKTSKGNIKEKVTATMDNLKHYLVDDAVAYERYVTGTKQRSVLREGVDRVRSSDMIAKSFVEQNGLKDLGKMSIADLNEFQQYLIAKRAVELSKRGIKTGRDIASDKALIQAIGDKYAAQEKIVRNYSDAMLDYSVRNGLISAELAAKLKKDSPNYVPMNRVMDEVSAAGGAKSKQLGNLSKQSVVKTIKGSDLDVANPIESMISNTMRMVNEAERNNVARMMAEETVLGERKLAEGEKARKGYDTIIYLVDGKKQTIEVPELVAREMKNLNGVLPKGADAILKVLGAPTKVLRAGATGANPIFALSNVVRDQFQVAITGNLGTYKRGTPKAFTAAFGIGKKASALRAELQQNGIIGNEYRQTYGYKPGELMAELQTEANLSKQAVQKLKHPIDSIADLIGRTEYFTRAQQYFGTDGDATAQAQAARNNTLNFSRGGEAVRIINRIVPFVNAGVQGGRITVAQMKQRPVRTTLALASFAGVAAAASAMAKGIDSELWDRLSDEEKKSNLIIFGNDAHYDPETNRIVGITKIPMPQMLYPVLDAVNNLKGEPEDILRITSDMIAAVTGVDTENPISQLTPTAAQPFIETAINKDLYTGQELVSEYDKNANPEDQGKKYTTGLARKIAETTGISAPIIDNFVSSWGGGLFQDLSKTLTDNPDNTKDGGGAGAIFTKGVTRRFLSGAVTSQYEIQEELAKGYKKAVKEDPTFQTLSAEDQKKTLDKIDADTRAIAGIAAKTEQNRDNEIKKDLTARQKSLIEDGFNASNYMASIKTSDGSAIVEQRDGFGITTNGKIKRNDEQTPSYSGDVSGLSEQHQSLLSMTTSELERAAESDDWSRQSQWHEAQTAALQKELDAVNKGYADGTKSKQDIEAIQKKIDISKKNTMIAQTNDFLMNVSEGERSKLLSGAGVNSVYELEQLYNSTSLTEWRKLPAGDIKNVLYTYDTLRKDRKVSGKTDDPTKNKYYNAKGSGAKTSTLMKQEQSNTARLAALIKQTRTPDLQKPTGVIDVAKLQSVKRVQPNLQRASVNLQRGSLSVKRGDRI